MAEERVVVMDKQGNKFTVPFKQLPKAISRGYVPSQETAPVNKDVIQPVRGDTSSLVRESALGAASMALPAGEQFGQAGLQDLGNVITQPIQTAKELGKAGLEGIAGMVGTADEVINRPHAFAARMSEPISQELSEIKALEGTPEGDEYSANVTGKLFGILAGVAGGKALSAVQPQSATGRVLMNARQSIGDTIRTPEGKLIPIKQKVADWAFPQSPARLEAQAMERKALERIQRGKEQAKLDAAAEKARLTQERARLATEREQAQLNRRKMRETLEQSIAHEAALAEDARMGRSVPNPNPPPIIRKTPESIAAAEAQAKSAILDPNVPTSSLVTLQSLTWEDLRSLAVKGDRAAIKEVYRRGREAEIPNIGFILERGKTFPHRESRQ